MLCFMGYIEGVDLSHTGQGPHKVESGVYWCSLLRLGSLQSQEMPAKIMRCTLLLPDTCSSICSEEMKSSTFL
ncbi:hypothetical protein NL676_033286 [Syzygium grande]|nr:hypothetical protein NL676_033286 [Syzygium grande]